MSRQFRICGIEPESIVDGPGFRYVIFTQGCPHHCPGCHNPQSHSFDGGYLMDCDTLLDQMRENPLLAGVTFSGGEPFCQPRPLIYIAEQVKKMGKNVFAYSGYTIEELLKKAKKEPDLLSLLRLCDTLVDGRYVQALRDLSLQFRGSSNQRIINVWEYLQSHCCRQCRSEFCCGSNGRPVLSCSPALSLPPDSALLMN